MKEILEKQEKSREATETSDSMKELVRIARASRIAQMAMVAGEAKIDSDEMMISEQLEVANKTLMEIKESLKSSLSSLANREFTSPEAKELAKDSVLSGSYMQTGWETFKDKVSNTRDAIVKPFTSPLETLSDITFGYPESGSVRGNSRSYKKAQSQYAKDRSDAFDATEGTPENPNPSSDPQFKDTVRNEFKNQQIAGRQVQEAEMEMMRRDTLGIPRTHAVNKELNEKFDTGMADFAANDPLKIGILYPIKKDPVAVKPEKESDPSDTFVNSKENKPDRNNMTIGLQLIPTKEEIEAEEAAAKEAEILAKKEEKNRKRREANAAKKNTASGLKGEESTVDIPVVDSKDIKGELKVSLEKANLKENTEQTKLLKVIADKLGKEPEEKEVDEKSSDDSKGIIQTLLDGLKGLLTSISGLGKIAAGVGGIAAGAAALGATGVGALAGSASGIAAIAGGVTLAGAAGYGIGTGANWIAEKTTGKSLSDRLLEGYEKLTGENYGVVPNNTGNKVAMTSTEVAGIKDSKAPIIVSAPAVTNLSNVSNGKMDKPMGVCRNPDSISEFLSNRYIQ